MKRGTEIDCLRRMCSSLCAIKELKELVGNGYCGVQTTSLFIIFHILYRITYDSFFIHTKDILYNWVLALALTSLFKLCNCREFYMLHVGADENLFHLTKLDEHCNKVVFFLWQCRFIKTNSHTPGLCLSCCTMIQLHRLMLIIITVKRPKTLKVEDLYTKQCV